MPLSNELLTALGLIPVASSSLPAATTAAKGATILPTSQTANVSAAGNTNIALTGLSPSKLAVITAAAGAGVYTATITLQNTGVIAGSFAVVHIDLAASWNPRLELRSLTSGGTLIGEAVGNGTARRVTFRCVYDGAAWDVVSRLPTSEVFRWTTAGSYTLTLPQRASAFEAFIVGGGGGGGSGRRGASGTNRYSGGGGSSGVMASLYHQAIPGAVLGITVGAAGVGGAAVSADDTSGNAGTAGGDTSVFQNGTPANRYIHAIGGNAGGGGTAAAGPAGSLSGYSSYGATRLGCAGTAGTTGAGSLSDASSSVGPAGGSSGGGLSATDTPASGGRSTWTQNFSGESVAGNGGAAPGGNGGSAPPPFGADTCGISGAGGASAVAGAAGSGGNGVRGSGGGSGGASQNGFASGAGGNGGAGHVRITVFY